jgi:hypothetical protein
MKPDCDSEHISLTPLTLQKLGDRKAFEVFVCVKSNLCRTYEMKVKVYLGRPSK